ncbi:LysR family transcriptional regulator [Parashewanella spongiae]|uniref:LysR family transcriptional regulator n=1 Tax=Parashewanella spongiae TaxID=342950 RepID=A0A3A6TFB6_9GAMM|nr:LysR family transcriptional regulator [Parashewanella spongiae]MCL1079496.1 LysR family transcriptional regulator [Parashewanella spongiae]RJY07537.1 LysR family transcriptional regulator [Parashewanella spongiae]
MRLRHIEIFHAIYTTGSITNAAKLLHVSQPSASKVLSHAELQLGFNLFDRIKGRLIPTDEAKMLFEEVDKIYQQMCSIKNTVQNIKKSEFGCIKLGVTPALGFDAIPNVIANYHHDYPNVTFDVHTIHNDEMMQSLLEHKCDLAVLFSPREMQGITQTPLAESELVIVYPKEMFPDSPATLTLSKISDCKFIDISDSGPLGDMLWTRVMEEDISFQSLIKVQTYFIAVRLVASGLGVCVVDRYTAEGNLSNDIAIASFEPALTFSISAVHLENRSKSKVIEEFIPYLTHGVSIS